MTFVQVFHRLRLLQMKAVVAPPQVMKLVQRLLFATCVKLLASAAVNVISRSIARRLRERFAHVRMDLGRPTSLCIIYLLRGRHNLDGAFLHCVHVPFLFLHKSRKLRQ